MKYADPQTVTCSRCSEESSQRVADLLGLRATCPICGVSFAEVGYEMRAGLDNWGNFLTLVMIAIRVEDTLGYTIGDAELESVRTLRDIARIVRRHLPSGTDCEDQAIELVRKAAKKLSWCAVEEVALDVPIMDAVNPDRWSRKYGKAE